MKDHWASHADIEAPISEMRDRMDSYHSNPYRYSDDPNHRAFASQLDDMAESMKDTEERHLRRELGLDAKHEQNTIRTAKALLLSNSMDPSIVTDIRIADSVFNKLSTVPSGGWNGFKTLKNLGTFGGAVAGAVGGGLAAKQRWGDKSIIVGALAGALGGGVFAHHALKLPLSSSINHREEEIDSKYEQNIAHAYESLKRRFNKD